MKKLISSILVISIVIIISGCSLFEPKTKQAAKITTAMFIDSSSKSKSSPTMSINKLDDSKSLSFSTNGSFSGSQYENTISGLTIFEINFSNHEVIVEGETYLIDGSFYLASDFDLYSTLSSGEINLNYYTYGTLTIDGGKMDNEEIKYDTKFNLKLDINLNNESFEFLGEIQGSINGRDISNTHWASHFNLRYKK